VISANSQLNRVGTKAEECSGLFSFIKPPGAFLIGIANASEAEQQKEVEDIRLENKGVQLSVSDDQLAVTDP